MLMLQTSTYTFRDTEELIAYQEGRYGSYEYGRYGNPTTRAVEEKIRVRLAAYPLAPLQHGLACFILTLPFRLIWVKHRAGDICSDLQCAATSVIAAVCAALPVFVSPMDVLINRMRSPVWTPSQVLEGAEDCLLSSSGMNAATTMLLALVPAGGHIVTTTDCYRRTRQFIQTVLPKMGITATVSRTWMLTCAPEHWVSVYQYSQRS